MKKFTPRIAFALVAVGALALAAVASALVTYDPATGGFVGKGDVQKAFDPDWNNKQLQDNAGGLSFTYEEHGTLTQTCEREAGNSQVITKDFKRVRNVNATVAHDARDTKKSGPNGGSGNGSSGSLGPITGFFLDPASGGNGGGLPTDICPDANDNPGQDSWHPISDVTFEATGAAGLFVHYGGVSYPL